MSRIFANLKRLSILAAVLGIFLTASMAPAAEPKPDCYDVSFGMDDYIYVNKLLGCANDAADISQTLQGQAGNLRQNSHHQQDR